MDAASFEDEYRRLRPPMQRRLARRVGPDLAADLVDEVFTQAWQHRDRYDPERGTLDQWLSGITNNVAASALRRQAASRRREAVLWERSEQSSHESWSVNRMDAALLVAALAVALKSLGPEDIDVLAPVILAALGGHRVARRTNLKHLRLRRARARLRAILGLVEPAKA